MTSTSNQSDFASKTWHMRAGGYVGVVVGGVFVFVVHMFPKAFCPVVVGMRCYVDILWGGIYFLFFSSVWPGWDKDQPWQMTT